MKVMTNNNNNNNNNYWSNYNGYNYKQLHLQYWYDITLINNIIYPNVNSDETRHFFCVRYVSPFWQKKLANDSRLL